MRMVNKSILTAIDGFLFGYVLYSTLSSSTLIIYLSGGIGYFIGLVFDKADRRHQVESSYLENIPLTHEVFYSSLLPEAVILYSIIDNITTILLDYAIEAKPEGCHLNVLNNLNDYNFKVIEDSSNTIISLNIEFPELNYPFLIRSEKELENLLFIIKKQSIDFQRAIQRIIPGLLLNVIKYPDIFGNQNRFLSDFSDINYKKSPRSSDVIDNSQIPILEEKLAVHNPSDKNED